MVDGRLGCFSPYLTGAQKTALRQLEEGLGEGRTEQVEEATQAFLRVSLELTWDALEVTEIEPTLAGFERLRQSEDLCEFAAGLRSLLWQEDAPSAFALILLEWSADRSAAPPHLELESLNLYLAASVPFYETWQPAGEQPPLAQPMSLLSPAIEPPTSDLPSLIDQLAESAADPTERGEVELSLIEPELGAPSRREVDLAVALLGATSFSELPAPSLTDESEVALLEEAPVPEPSLESLPEPVAEAETVIEAERAAVADEKTPLQVVEDPVDVSVPEAPGEEAAEAGREPATVSDLRASRAAPPPPVLEAPAVVAGEEGVELLDVSAAPLSPLERRTGLIIKKKYLGYGKNISGVMGYCGQLTLSRYDDEALEGRLESSNPLLFLTETVLKGKVASIAYWMPPAAFPQPGGHLTVRAPGGNKVLSVSSLFPQSRTDFLSGPQVLLMMLAPAVLGLLYFSFVYILSVSEIVTQVREVFPEAYAAASAGSSAVSFRAQGVGLYQLEVVPASESLQLIWAALIWFCPLLSAKFFRHLSRSRQRDWGMALGAALLLPSLGLFGLWHAQKWAFPLLDHADFSPLDLRYFWPWGLPLNLAVALYLFLSVHGVWDRRLPSGLRWALPVLLSLLYLAIGFGLIFGRSWLS